MAVVPSSSLEAIPMERPSSGDVGVTPIPAAAGVQHVRCARPWSDAANLEAGPRYRCCNRGCQCGPSGPGTGDLLVVSFRLGVFDTRAALAGYALHFELSSVQGGIEKAGAGELCCRGSKHLCPGFPCPVLMT